LQLDLGVALGIARIIGRSGLRTQRARKCKETKQTADRKASIEALGNTGYRIQAAKLHSW
jgi:hypothetical protein